MTTHFVPDMCQSAKRNLRSCGRSHDHPIKNLDWYLVTIQLRHTCLGKVTDVTYEVCRHLSQARIFNLFSLLING